MDAIKSSRRTILVLSILFGENVYTEFECDVALYEVITAKHRIIPVILEYRHFKQEHEQEVKIYSAAFYLYQMAKESNQ